ncbi:MAG: hypothetical protein ACFNKK_06160 [Peptidiphaga sp.]
MRKIKRKRLVLSIVALSIVGWLYFVPPHARGLNTGEEFNCEPLGYVPGNSDYFFSDIPDGGQGTKLENYVNKVYSTSSNEEKSEFMKEAAEGWRRSCDRARDTRKVLLTITLVVWAVAFLRLPKDPPRASAKPETQHNGETQPQRDGGTPRDGASPGEPTTKTGEPEADEPKP